MWAGGLSKHCTSNRTKSVLSAGGFSTSPFINQPFPPAKGPKAIMSMSLLFSYPAPVAESSGSQKAVEEKLLGVPGSI
jgi:hypothetical protein